MGLTEHPREDAVAQADALALEHADATIGVYPLGPVSGDAWVVIALCADGSAITSVFTRGLLTSAMLEAARWSGQMAVRGHDPSRVTYRPQEGRRL